MGYDKSKDKTYTMYLDANNLYGWAVTQSLPTHEFDWLTEKEIRSRQPRINLVQHHFYTFEKNAIENSKCDIYSSMMFTFI